MRRDVVFQLERGGVRKAFKGVLKRAAGKRVKGHLLEAGRRLVAFTMGLLLASLYGAVALFLQKQPLWPCVYTTLGAAGLAAFGMGLSAGVRTDVAVLLPTLCSARGKSFLFFLFASVLLTGPVDNTLQNMERAAASLVCGAELAANQTQELMQRAATPLLSALKSIRLISRNVHAVAGRVQSFIIALTDSVRHVARTLRNVLHFLVDIGEECNARLGSPYRKCRAVFAEARTDCAALLGEFDFLCDIVDAFLPLCGLARAGELFCVIPSYIASFLKKRLAAPTVAAFQRMKQEFDFNISTSMTFDLEANSSRSLHQVAQDIMEEVSSDLHIFQKISEPLMYGGLVLLVLSFLRSGLTLQFIHLLTNNGLYRISMAAVDLPALNDRDRPIGLLIQRLHFMHVCVCRAVRYKRRYLRELDFDNVYITKLFEKLNQQVALGGGTSVLPLTGREAKTYIRPLSCHLTFRERRAVLVAVVSVVRHLVMGGVLVALDFLVFWMLDQVHHQVKGDVVARAPVLMTLQVEGGGYASDIFRDVVAAFNVLQRGNLTVLSRKCHLEPSEPDYVTCFTLGFLLGLALLVSLFGGFLQRCRRLICASYHPERELERIQFLRQQILDQRREVGKALRASAARRRADGGGGGGSRFQTFLLRLPGGTHLSHLLARPSLSCLSCGETVRQIDVVACDVPRCAGLFCRPCFLSLGSTCVLCTRPLTSREEREEELDSSDDDQLNSKRIATATGRRTTVEDAGGSDIIDSDSHLSRHHVPEPTRVRRQ
ncbi:DC-STAMP domain-containing protein 2 isoform 2-T2 [Spinachia spinachia]